MDNLTDQNTPITTAGKLLAEKQEKLKRIRAEREALMGPIKAKLAKLDEEVLTTLNTYSELIGAEVSKVTFEDLTDPFRAMSFFEASWNDGCGVDGKRDAYRLAFGDCYVLDAETYSYGENPELVYMAPRVSIPEKADEEKLARTAEKVEAVHRTNMEILGDWATARISVFSDSDYIDFIVFDSFTQKWALETLYGTRGFESNNLIEVLKQAPTYS